VGNLPYSIDDSGLREMFAPHGEVVSANVIINRNSGRSRGFGFVEMASEDARKAIGALHDQEVEGRRLIVDEARPRR
jgi:RNA recognition motif-containing protein